MGQSIRRSQFITTYGPGAILEGKNGPRIIPSLDSSGIFDNRQVTDFEITDSRLSNALLNGAGILRIPSNAELGFTDSQDVYITKAFPSWALCTYHQILYLKRPGIGNSKQACPRCTLFSSEEAAWQRVRHQAIRFIRACPRGHLDDVDWIGIIQHQKRSCQPHYLIWQGGGSALRNINIVCPDCLAPINLGYAYSGRTWPCSGRFPELVQGRTSCDAEAKLLQRGASNLRMPELYTSLTIPPADTALYRLLDSKIIRGALILRNVTSKQEMITVLNMLVIARSIGRALVDEVNRYNEAEILTVVKQLSDPLPETNRAMRHEEFEALKRAALSGAPPQRSKTPGAPPLFEVVQQDVKEFLGPDNKYKLRITPISRLRVVMVQKGYRRIDPLKGDVVECVYVDKQSEPWYPGVEHFGEGIFIDLSPTSLNKEKHFLLKGDQIWFSAWRDPAEYKQRVQPDADEQDYLHPVFIWWHTFAHRLINALSIDSGYSSAAVRERVYVDIDATSGEAIGGILLYTAQPGGDGTLGGMIALVPQFDRVLKAAFNTIDSCSNDPLCSDVEFGTGKYNGSACYACLLVSETSCEHRNTRLDRTLLKENLP